MLGAIGDYVKGWCGKCLSVYNFVFDVIQLLYNLDRKKLMFLECCGLVLTYLDYTDFN